MKKIHLFTLALLGLLSGACRSAKSSDATPTTETMQTENNRFALDLLSRTLAAEKSEPNLCVSPLSASWAMSMAANGAQGETRAQIVAALGCGDHLDALNEYQKELVERLTSGDSLTTVGIANSVWLSDRLEAKKSFVENCRRYYNAQVESLDLGADAVQRINSWCSRQTAGRITEIVDQLRGDMMALLINALYFKGSWADAFVKSNTTDAPFYTPSGDSLNVKMMRRRGHMGYYENDTLQMATLAFGDNDKCLSILLPRDGMGTEELSRLLTPAKWDEWKRGSSHREVNLSMPRFTMQYGIKLNKILQQMGITDAFDDKADFGAMSRLPLQIDEVKQKCFIKVDEEGAEAAAVTSVGIRLMSSMMPQPCPTMRVNRPFLFVLHSLNENAILFTGSISEPKEK